MTLKYRQYIQLLVIAVILVSSLIATANVFAVEDNPDQPYKLFLPSTMDQSALSQELSQPLKEVQSSLLLEAFGAEVHERLQAGEFPWDLDLQLTPEQWDAWYHLDRVVKPSILLDAYGPVVYAQLEAGHYPTDLGLALTSEQWDAWYGLDKMGDEDLLPCPAELYDLEARKKRQEERERNGTETVEKWDKRPVCIMAPEVVIDHTQAISDVLEQGGSPSDIGISDDPH